MYASVSNGSIAGSTIFSLLACRIGCTVNAKLSSDHYMILHALFVCRGSKKNKGQAPTRVIKQEQTMTGRCEHMGAVRAADNTPHRSESSFALRL